MEKDPEIPTTSLKLSHYTGTQCQGDHMPGPQSFKTLAFFNPLL